MLASFARRGVFMLVTVLAVTVVGFLIIQLPPGDFLTLYILELEASGEVVDEATVDNLRRRYGLDLPPFAQYLRWLGNLVRGDFGLSFGWNRPVRELIGERLALTVTIALLTLFISYLLAIPIGIYSAVHQYSFTDYAFTVVGFVGLALPNFLFALILLYLFFVVFDIAVVGLFSSEFINAPWSVARVIDMLKHLPVPLLVIGLSGTAGLIRVMRGSLLDELRKQYVVTARSKGLHERVLLFRYPVRLAINPIISSVSWQLPQIVSGAVIVAVVLNLPTLGPLLLRALLTQDMFLAGTIIVMITILAVLGAFISDLMLMWVDPRIRFERAER